MQGLFHWWASGGANPSREAREAAPIIIEARNLRKRFRVRTRAAGAMGALRGMAAPRWRAVHAVDDIDLEVAPGEAIAFIGPNGAGKSTTIKLLTGILQRDTGTVSVLGLDPQRQRRRLAYRIGTVFGQKSRLWFHLPPLDTFKLLADIYDLEPRQARERIAFLTEVFGIGRHLATPVRKLSLGERKPVLPNLLASRMSVSSWGDLLYGLGLFAVSQPLTPASIGLFLLFVLLAAGVLVTVRVLYHSLTFLLGNAEDLAGLGSEQIITFSLYPGTIFDAPVVAVILHTVIPAALVAHLPADLFRAVARGTALDWRLLAVVIGGDAALIAASCAVFALGLRRYESGNRIGARI